MAYTFQPGDQFNYTFTSEGTLTLGAADSGNSAQALRLTETAHFRVTIYAATPTGWLAGLTVQDAKVESLEHTGDVTDKTPADFVNSQIFVSLDKSGRIAQVQVSFNLSPDARNSWRDLLAKWQVILPPAAAKKWTRVEEDATGSYVAQYALTDSNLTKNKTHYLRVNGADAAVLASYKVAGTEEIEFAGLVRNVTGTEKVSLGGANSVPPVSSTGNFTLRLDGSTHLAQVSAPSTANYTPMKWSAEFAPSVAPPEDDGDFTANLRDLRELIAQGGYNSPEEIRVAAKLISQIIKDNNLADQLLDALRGDDVSQPLASAVLGILGAAGTAAAQYDLLAVATTDDWPPATRQMALFSLVQAQEPVPEADAMLQSLFAQGNDLSGTALLVLAAEGDKVRASDPLRYQQINDFVLGVLNTPSLPLNDLIVALDAIGNLGPAQVPDAVAKALQNDNELVRMKAVTSLARINTNGALALLDQAIANDPDPDVQDAAVKTLAALKGANVVSDLANIAANGKSSAARQEALTQLTNLAPNDPKTAAAVNTAASSDPSTDVRNYATKLQANLPGNSNATGSP